MDISHLENRLLELEERWGNWSGPITQPIHDYDPLLELEAYRNEITEFMNQLCLAYLSASTSQREKIRSLRRDRANFPGSFDNYIRESADRLRSFKDQQWLRLGLAAASIENLYNDFRDTLLALSELYVASEEVGIDPRPHFQEIADISSDTPAHPDGTSTKSMLANFHTYAVLKERKGELTPEDKQSMLEEVEKLFEGHFPSSSSKASWWERIFGS
jgi:hypothetical protein